MQHLRCRAVHVAVMDSVIWNGWSSIREPHGCSSKCDERRSFCVSFLFSRRHTKSCVLCLILHFKSQQSDIFSPPFSMDRQRDISLINVRSQIKGYNGNDCTLPFIETRGSYLFQKEATSFQQSISQPVLKQIRSAGRQHADDMFINHLFSRATALIYCWFLSRQQLPDIYRYDHSTAHVHIMRTHSSAINLCVKAWRRIHTHYPPLSHFTVCSVFFSSRSFDLQTHLNTTCESFHRTSLHFPTTARI